MFRRISLFAIVGLLAVFVLAACGEDDEGVEPTVTRIPATDVPQAPSPTTAAEQPAEGSPIAGSPAAGSPDAASPTAGEEGSPIAEATPPAAGSPVVTAEVSPTAPVETALTLDLLDIRYEPTELRISANTDVTLNLVNEGVAPHTFDVDQLNIHSGELAGGQTASVTINAAPGTYEFHCAVPGHKEAGMVGTLIVE